MTDYTITLTNGTKYKPLGIAIRGDGYIQFEIKDKEYFIPDYRIKHIVSKKITKPITEQKPILIDDFEGAIEVEESLSLDDKTKELTIKALSNNKSKIKGAADELGILERTLYRKIKKYNITI